MILKVSQESASDSMGRDRVGSLPMKKTALITGIAGQDGCYLSKLLLQSGYQVYGTTHSTDRSRLWRLEEEGHLNDIDILHLDLRDRDKIADSIKELCPTELYNLGAQSLVGKSSTHPFYTSEVNAMGALALLEAVRKYSPETRYYQASSSEIYGNTQESPQSEKTCFQPRNPYGVSKQYAHWMTKTYRTHFGLHTSCGILFNHESPYRGEDFVTGKITQGLARVSLGMLEKIEVGNVQARRDWGFSGDYVRAMHMMLQQPQGDEYVVSTGRLHTVQDLINAAAQALEMSLEWQGEELETVALYKGREVVSVNSQFFRKNETSQLVGDSSKAREVLGWEPQVSFEQLITMMVQADLRRLQSA